MQLSIQNSNGITNFIDMEIELVRTDSSNEDFQNLVNELNAYLAELDGDEHEFYSQFNAIDQLKNVVVAYMYDKPVACGAMKAHDTEAMEIKRMFTSPENRGHGLGSKIVSELETWAKELGYTAIVLETGDRQPDAIALYLKMGFEKTANYGQYIGIANSRCFRKTLVIV